MSNLRIAAAFAAALALATGGAMAPAHAGTPAELVFDADALAGLEADAVVTYGHTRTGEGGEELQPIEDGEVTLNIQTGEDGKLEALLEMSEARGQRGRRLHAFPAEVGNPLVMTFLESSLRSMARVTGGSPFYIRNRIKDALRDGGAVEDVTFAYEGVETPARRVLFEPFADDPNRDRMGAFADMTIAFVVAESAPGGFLELRAEAPALEEGGAPAFLEEMLLDGAEVAQ